MSNLHGLKLNYAHFYTFKTIILICLSQTKTCSYCSAQWKSMEQDILESRSTNVQFVFKSKITYFHVKCQHTSIHYFAQNMCYLSITLNVSRPMPIVVMLSKQCVF